MVKHICLSVFDHFVGLALKGLKDNATGTAQRWFASDTTLPRFNSYNIFCDEARAYIIVRFT